MRLLGRPPLINCHMEILSGLTFLKGLLAPRHVSSSRFLSVLHSMGHNDKRRAAMATENYRRELDGTDKQRQREYESSQLKLCGVVSTQLPLPKLFWTDSH
jgi:hypothetical protein